MKELFDDMDELIGKVLAGEASGPERVSVNKWISLSTENRHYFGQLKTIFNTAGANSVTMQFDADAAWQKVKNKLPKEGSEAVPVRISYWPSLRIAAGVSIVLVAGYIFWGVLSPVVQIQEVASGMTTKNNTLPDGTTAFLNRKSKLTFQYNPRKNIREVKLSGEAFFDVKHEKTKPFVIETEEVLIRDIGTAFNVQAWPESKTVEVTVEEGEVQFYTRSNPGVSLHAGERGIYDKTLKEFSIVEKTDTNVLAYKTKVFTFNNTDLGSVVALISSVYNVDIQLSDEALNSCRLTVNFNNDPLDTIIDVISETMGLTVIKKESEIILSGTGCQK